MKLDNVLIGVSLILASAAVDNIESFSTWLLAAAFAGIYIWANE